MTETEWLTSADPVALVNYLIYEQKYTPGPVSEPGIIPYRRAPLVSNRKLRLFACACVRQVWHLVTDHRSRRAVEIAERMEDHVDGPETYQARRQRAEYEAWGVSQQGPDGVPDDTLSEARQAARQAAFCVNKIAINAANGSANLNCCVPAASVRADLLREIVGNPFRPQPLLTRTVYCDRCNGKGQRTLGKTCGMCDGSGQTKGNADWLTPTVQGLASAAYEHRTPQGHLDPARLAVLADALEEAGCSQQCESCGGSRLGHDNNGMCGDCEGSGWVEHDILTHLRGPGPHVRGCWVIDVILGLD